MFDFDEPYRRDLALVGLGALVVVLCVGGAFAHLSLTSQSATYLTVEETDTIYPHGEVVAFESLPPAQQRAFEAALVDEDNRVGVTEASTEVWTDHRAVSYRGALYEVTVLAVD